MQTTELEAVLSDHESEAYVNVKQSLLLWSFGFIIIVGNLLFNPLWEGSILSKIWLPVIYLAALVLLLVSKYNHRTQAGRIVFEKEWIRVYPKGSDTIALRIFDLEDVFIDSGKPGFFRNPLQKHTFGILHFRSNGQYHEYHFRLLRTTDKSVLATIKNSWLV